MNMALGVRYVRGDAEHVVTELKIFLMVNAITSWLIILVAQNSATDRRYALVLGLFKGRIELIIPFEVPPVLLKKLGSWCSADLGWLNIGQLQVPAGIQQAKH